jgi:valyl-tRNA synthetase
MNLTEEDDELLKMPADSELAIEDKWILSRFNTLAKTVNDNIANYELGIALSEIYSFTWDTFCDWYIEMAKSRIFEKGSVGAKTAKSVLCYVLTAILKLLHPFMPFITEEIYGALPGAGESIMISEYPDAKSIPVYEDAAEDIDRIITAITAIRNRRAEMNVPPSKRAKLFVVTKYESTFKSTAKILEKLAGVSEVILTDAYAGEDAVSIATEAGNLYIPLADVIDFEKEKARLTAEIEKNEGEILRIEKKLSNEGFVAKAPAAVIEGEKKKLEKYLSTRESLAAAIAKLK